MKALSVRAPWWWFILHGGKDIENRDWSTRFRGTIALHASSWYSMSACLPDMEFGVRTMYLTGRRGPEGMERLTHRHLMPSGGHIVGTVDIVDCVDQSPSPWFFGRYGFVLANPVAFKVPFAIKGKLSFFNVSDEAIERARAA